MSKKERNARGASDLNPIETTQRQAAVTSAFGQNYWRTGPSPTYKFGDQWVLSDRFLMDVQYAHVGNNFILDFHEDALTSVQPILIVNTGLNLRSGAQSVNIRPVNSVNFNANYFLPVEDGRRPRVQVRRLLARRAQRHHQPHRRQRDGALPDPGGATTPTPAPPAAWRPAAASR